MKVSAPTSTMHTTGLKKKRASLGIQRSQAFSTQYSAPTMSSAGMTDELYVASVTGRPNIDEKLTANASVIIAV